jgi:hypothetical protein
MFNAFKYTKQLEEAGFSREQAEIQLQVITEIVEGDLATKQDLEIFWTSLRQDFKTLETSLRQELKTVATSLRQDMKTLETGLRQDLKTSETGLHNRMDHFEGKLQQLEYRLTIKLGTFLIIGFTAMASLMKFWLLH